MVSTVDSRLVEECTQFLFREAEVLDRGELSGWLDLLAPDIQYRIPVRSVTERGAGPGISVRAFYMDEDLRTLKTRIARLESEFAWAEDPPTRTRRFISNIRLRGVAGAQGFEEVSVVSNMAVYCYRGDTPVPIILTGERQDLLRRVNGDWKLACRLVLLDSAVLGLQALSIFL